MHDDVADEQSGNTALKSEPRECGPDAPMKRGYPNPRRSARSRSPTLRRNLRTRSRKVTPLLVSVSCFLSAALPLRRYPRRGQTLYFYPCIYAARSTFQLSHAGLPALAVTVGSASCWENHGIKRTVGGLMKGCSISNDNRWETALPSKSDIQTRMFCPSRTRFIR
jgi:hypothetical protein